MGLCDKVVDANVALLAQLKGVLESLPSEVYLDTSQPPYFFSIGAQTRHILDMYDSLIKGYRSGRVDFTERDRNKVYETDPHAAIKYLERMQNSLKGFYSENLETKLDLKIEPDVGIFEEIPITLGGIFGMLFFHTFHHHAMIAQLSSGLGYTIPDGSFGYNPSTTRFLLQEGKCVR